MSKHYTTKYSSKQLRDAKVTRDASKRRSNKLGPTAVVTDMDDIANHSARMAVQAQQIEECGDVLFY